MPSLPSPELLHRHKFGRQPSSYRHIHYHFEPNSSIQMSSPTFVFSLGAWVVPAVFDTTRSRLETLGFPSECPAHPSIGAEPPTKTLADDISSLRGVLNALANEGRDLVVVAHSYGGVVASSAVEGLSKTARMQAGKPGGIVKIVYLAAFALDKGQSLLGMLGGNYLPWMKVEVSLPSVCPSGAKESPSAYHIELVQVTSYHFDFDANFEIG